MRDRIKQLEEKAARLEPSEIHREELNRQTVQYAESFLSRLPEMKTFEPDRGRSAPLEESFSEEAEALPALLETIDSAVIHEGINAASGGHMGYIPGGGIYPAALGDYLADVTNRYSGVAFASPGSAKMEQQLVRWMADLVGYPAEAGGDLTSGGSIANLSAIIAARQTMGIRARHIEDSCIYLTDDAHHCVDKALRAAGLAECQTRRVAMDDQFRMDAGSFRQMLNEDIAAGLRPWLVIASAGTTDSGAIDPIDELAVLAEEHDMWLHVDAAYGGFFLLCEEGRQVRKGLAREHSMQDATPGSVSYSPADLSLELSRPFRGMRFWLPLKLFGVAPFRAALSEKIWLARYFHEQLDRIAGWEVGPYPALSVVSFRYVPETGDADQFNRRLAEQVHADGRVFISTTLISGHFALRLAVLHFRTHLSHVDYLLNLLQRLVR